MASVPYTKHIFCFILIMAIFLSIFSQEIGLRKSLIDDKTGITYNNFRTNPAETIFYEVKLDRSLVYDSPKKNAELIYSLNVNTLIEYLELGPQKNFIKIRILDKGTDIVEGWVRKKSLSKMKYFGRSFLSLAIEKTEKSEIVNNLKDPHWVKGSDQKTFSNKELTGSEVVVLNKGDIVFIDSLFSNAARVKFEKAEGIYISCYVDKEILTPLAIIDNAKTNLDELFKDIDPLVFMYGLNKSGFISYSGLSISNTLRTNFNEDKVCRELGKDSLMYKFTFSDDINSIVKRYESKLKPSKHNFAMYRRLPNETIITRSDTLDCKVIEIIHTPKSASVTSNNIEKLEVTNKISKFFVYHIDNLDMNMVFQKETDEYFWSYEKDLKNGSYIDQKYKPTKIIQRVTAFRKYDLEK
ncbi:MAG: hypothetical protein KAH33_00595 [Candidatus Delongbacteria bacterium]|nr:hypothetical protein [Candidatus Delongbacteria bacterium]